MKKVIVFFSIFFVGTLLFSYPQVRNEVSNSTPKGIPCSQRKEAVATEPGCLSELDIAIAIANQRYQKAFDTYMDIANSPQPQKL